MFRPNLGRNGRVKDSFEDYGDSQDAVNRENKIFDIDESTCILDKQQQSQSLDVMIISEDSV